jgi:hypothetical protein
LVVVFTTAFANNPIRRLVGIHRRSRSNHIRRGSGVAAVGVFFGERSSCSLASISFDHGSVGGDLARVDISLCTSGIKSQPTK